MYNLWDFIKSSVAELFQKRAVVMILAFCLMFSILVGRLFHLQIVSGQDYLDDYTLQIQKTRTIQGTRGNIYDRNGKLLAYNELAYSVTIEDNGEYADLKEKNRELNKEIQDIIRIVEENGDEVISDFSIVLDSNDQYQFSMTNETQRLRFAADVFGKKTIDELSDEQRNMSAEDIVHYLCTDSTYGYGIDEKELSREETLKIVNIRYAIGLKSFQKYIPVTVANDVSDETVAGIMESMSELPGVDISEETMRRYADSKYFANIIGYTGTISQDEYNALSEEEKEKYDPTDTVGKSGLEQVMDSTLQGEKGEAKFYVNSVGKVIGTAGETEPTPGNNLYLSVDAELQKAAYDILEQELAGILLRRMSNVLDYDRAKVENATDVIVPSGDAYISFIANDILDMSHFAEEDAKKTEKKVYQKFASYKEDVLEELGTLLNDRGGKDCKDLSREWRAYLSYVTENVLTAGRIIDSDAIDTKDDMYKAWQSDDASEKTFNIYEYLSHAISENWIDASGVQEYMEEEGRYSDSLELYGAIVNYAIDALTSSSGFDKLIYEYMIRAGKVTGTELCMILYEQEVLKWDETQYNNLSSGATSAYDFLREKIRTLELTPGQLGLEPCTASTVWTDVNTGEVLACVSYPGYDNNRLANSMDSKYYNQLLTSSARPFYNNATQETTAPGSIYKPLVAIAGLTEGAVDLSTTVSCDGIYTGVTPSVKCWLYPGSHGTMDVVEGIANSCNEYFCNIGLQLGMKEKSTDALTEEEALEEQEKKTYSSDEGISKLEKYANMFGLNDTSGLEIPETSPKISDEDSVRSAIGQGTNNFTVSQLARYITAIANKGTVYDLSLLHHVENVDGTIEKTYEPAVKNKVEGISDTTWNAVHSGMRGVIRNSSAFKVMNSTDISISGKTGTAQQSDQHANHGLVSCFAPSENPEIAMTIRIANGYGSTYPSEAAADMLEYYYEVTPASKIITGEAAEVSKSSFGE